MWRQASEERLADLLAEICRAEQSQIPAILEPIVPFVHEFFSAFDRLAEATETEKRDSEEMLAKIHFARALLRNHLKHAKDIE